MRSNKKYTNLTFTKRVDHDPGHTSARRISEPAVCTSCDAVYAGGRWTLAENAPPPDPFDQAEPFETLCPGCARVNEGIPAGFVYIEGNFYRERFDEIGRLLRNEEKKMLRSNPLARIIDIKTRGNKMVVTTTTEHLGQHIGRAVNKAFGGDVRYNFSHENKLVRVYCERPD